ncbi:hypothetical protein RvY_17523 [Ramazzottius varieornatus]|uniref:Uncharacterized protein n=1 Tax=Ramazzottius varieornatus TaxID=947166 RepID=A0A1D1W384_RAMVA|nr:hypothetical protein RvY_17523 [Ramazzottius varieornatus]
MPEAQAALLKRCHNVIKVPIRDVIHPLFGPDGGTPLSELPDVKAEAEIHAHAALGHVVSQVSTAAQTDLSASLLQKLGFASIQNGRRLTSTAFARFLAGKRLSNQEDSDEDDPFGALRAALGIERQEVVLQVGDGTQTSISGSCHRISDAHRVQSVYSSMCVGDDHVHNSRQMLPQDHQHSAVDEQDDRPIQRRKMARRGPDGKAVMSSMKAHAVERLVQSPVQQADMIKQRIDKGLKRAGIQRDGTGLLTDKEGNIVQRDLNGVYRSQDGTVLSEEPKTQAQALQAEIQKGKIERGLHQAGIQPDQAGGFKDKNGDIVERDGKGVYRAADGTVLFQEPKRPVEAALAKAGISQGEDGLWRNEAGNVVQRDQKGIYRSPDGAVLFQEPGSPLEAALAKAGLQWDETGVMRNQNGELVQRDKEGLYRNPNGTVLFQEEKPGVEKALAKAGVFKDEDGVYRDEKGEVVQRDDTGVYRREDGTALYDEAKTSAQNGLALAGVQLGEDGVLRNVDGEVVQRGDDGVYRKEDGTVLYKEEKQPSRRINQHGFEILVEEDDEDFEFFGDDETAFKQVTTKRTKKTKQALNSDGTPRGDFNLVEQEELIEEEEDEEEDNGFGLSPSDVQFAEQNNFKRKKKEKKAKEAEGGFVIDIEELEDEEELGFSPKPAVRVIKRKVKDEGKVGPAYSDHMVKEEEEYLEDDDSPEEGGAHLSADVKDQVQINFDEQLFRQNMEDTHYGVADRTSNALRTSLAYEQSAAYRDYMSERLQQEDSYLKLEHIGSLQELPEEYVDEGEPPLPQDFFLALMRGYCDKCRQEIKFMDLKELFRYKLLHKDEEDFVFDPEHFCCEEFQREMEQLLFGGGVSDTVRNMRTSLVGSLIEGAGQFPERTSSEVGELDIITQLLEEEDEEAAAAERQESVSESGESSSESDVSDVVIIEEEAADGDNSAKALRESFKKRLSRSKEEKRLSEGALKGFLERDSDAKVPKGFLPSATPAPVYKKKKEHAYDLSLPLEKTKRPSSGKPAAKRADSIGSAGSLGRRQSQNARGTLALGAEDADTRYKANTMTWSLSSKICSKTGWTIRSFGPAHRSTSKLFSEQILDMAVPDIPAAGDGFHAWPLLPSTILRRQDVRDSKEDSLSVYANQAPQATNFYPYLDGRTACITAEYAPSMSIVIVLRNTSLHAADGPHQDGAGDSTNTPVCPVAAVFDTASFGLLTNINWTSSALVTPKNARILCDHVHSNNGAPWDNEVEWRTINKHAFHPHIKTLQRVNKELEIDIRGRHDIRVKLDNKALRTDVNCGFRVKDSTYGSLSQGPTTTFLDNLQTRRQEIRKHVASLTAMLDEASSLITPGRISQDTAPSASLYTSRK